MNHLRVVLHVLKEHQLFANYRKCEFWLRLVMFIGHIFSYEGVMVYLGNTEVVKIDIGFGLYIYKEFFRSIQLL